MRIAVIPGDGIGVETTAEAVKAIRAAGDAFGRPFDLEMLPWGADHFLQTGVTVPVAEDIESFPFLMATL